MTAPSLLQGDCRNLMAAMDEASVDSIVTDPPYELSSDGKASATRVFAEVVFPEYPKISVGLSGEDQLAFLISKVLCLGDRGDVPSPASAVPITTVAFHNDGAHRKEYIEDSDIASLGVPCGDARFDVEAEPDEYLGCFSFKLTDATAALDALHRAGCGFISGGVGVGFAINAASLPRLLRSGSAVVFGDHDVGVADDTLAVRVSALWSAEDSAVARLSCSGGDDVDVISAPAALTLFAALQDGRAQAIAARSGASRLPAKCQARRIRVVCGVTNRAISFDLVTHALNLSSVGFMGNEWDGSKIANDVAMWAAALRVLKPGGYLLAFSHARTYHRMVCAIEDAGFEVRDQIMWIYGSGFPKGGNRDGKGTCLKPAHEPIVVARKPFKGSALANIATHGTGAMNIDACRAGESGARNNGRQAGTKGIYGHIGATTPVDYRMGRWPANVVHDGSDEVLTAFPNAPGQMAASRDDQRTQGNVYGVITKHGGRIHQPRTDETISAARFFYCAKASKADRDDGLDAFDPQAFVQFQTGNGESGSASSLSEGRSTEYRNTHPTVKPTALMRWLVRLVTPPGGLVLDPFAGSVSTGRAAVLEGLRFIGCEITPEYLPIARARIAGAEAKVAAYDRAPVPQADLFARAIA